MLQSRIEVRTPCGGLQDREVAAGETCVVRGMIAPVTSVRRKIWRVDREFAAGSCPRPKRGSSSGPRWPPAGAPGRRTAGASGLRDVEFITSLRGCGSRRARGMPHQGPQNVPLDWRWLAAKRPSKQDGFNEQTKRWRELRYLPGENWRVAQQSLAAGFNQLPRERRGRWGVKITASGIESCVLTERSAS